MSEILQVPNKNFKNVSEGQPVDVYIKRGSDEYYIDIKTVGPNKTGFLSHKALTLTWIARADKQIHTILALPYNPYHPEPYKKVGSEVMQVGLDLMVGKDFWDLVGGTDCYEEIQQMFKKIGSKYWKKLKTKF